MNNMWSENKYIETSINALLFLMAMNFLHVGQFALPIICLLLFIDNKFRLNIKNIKLFILFVLFAISFFIFGYKQGLYSVIGFCLPMAYYIGSNMLEKTPNNIKKLIYIIACGMACHVLLNFSYDYYINKMHLFDSGTHYDFWTKVKASATGTATNYAFIISCIPFIIFNEKKLWIKVVGISTMITMFIYNYGLGRRMPVVLCAIIIVFYFLLELISKKSLNYRKIVIYSVIALFLFLILLFVYINNIFGFNDFLNKSTLFKKFAWGGLKPGRLFIYEQALPYLLKYPWGNRMIASEVENLFHDLWFDIYDYAGIIPFILILIITIYLFVNAIKMFNKKEIDYKFRELFIMLSLSILLIFLLEPVITGSSIFLICSIVFLSCLSCC